MSRSPVFLRKIRFTPGEWRTSSDRTAVYSASNRLVCQVAPRKVATQQAANAHLIAAAPELLSNLEWALDVLVLAYEQMGINKDNAQAYQDALTAVQKARGELP